MKIRLAQQRATTSAIARTLRLTTLAALLSTGFANLVQAQEVSAPTDENLPAPAGSSQPSASSDSTGIESVPPFDFGGAVAVSESYVDNSSGIAGGSPSDTISTLRLDAHLHERTSSLTLDANYSGHIDFYNGGTQPTQFSNNLLALGIVDAIPEYLTLGMKAFASPVLVSDIGVLTADDRVVANGFRLSYGFNVQPDLRFRLGDFATSETTPIYGATFFTNPAGTASTPIIPGLPGPTDTSIRGGTQVFRSGEDFDRLTWNAIGAFIETEHKQNLLSDKEGTGTFKYAIDHDFALLTTIGYEAINDTTPIARNVSGLVALGGFSYAPSQTFQVQIEVGQKYRDLSIIGNLLYSWSPTSEIVASANDAITTPEGQLLDSLNNLIATPSGDLTSNDDLLENGVPASLSSFSLNSFGNSFDQNIYRNQRLSLSWLEDFERNHLDLSIFANRRTFIAGTLIGPPRTESWGSQLALSRDISPVTRATVSGAYYVTEELGGTARVFDAHMELSYALSRELALSLQGSYIDRQSSTTLDMLSPFTGSLSDYRIAVQLSRTF